MENWTNEDLEEKLRQTETGALFLYAPICGTCIVAEKMLTVTEQLHPHLTYAKADLNYHNDFAEQNKIMSVPCLALFSNGKIVKQIYAFKSVQNLLSQLHEI